MDLWTSTLGHSKTKEFLESALGESRLPHSLLFVGMESIGKKRLAYALAQKLSCETKSACGKCGPCLRMANKQSENAMNVICHDYEA